VVAAVAVDLLLTDRILITVHNPNNNIICLGMDITTAILQR
jgi:hypothetical protein